MKSSLDWPNANNTIRDWDTFLKITTQFAAIPYGYHPAYLFRGQASDKWTLDAGLHRLLPKDTKPEDALKIEDDSIQMFLRHSHHHVPVGSLRNLAGEPSVSRALCAMRHFGVPTRLLDWTASIFVAAYFAVDSLPEEDGVLFAIHAGEVQREYTSRTKGVKARNSHIIKPDAEKIILVVDSPEPSERELAQQGFFTLPMNIMCGQDEVLTSTLGPIHERENGVTVRLARFRIDRKSKATFLKNLRSMNVTAASLFPGLDGIGRSVFEMMRLLGQ